MDRVDEARPERRETDSRGRREKRAGIEPSEEVDTRET